MIGCLRRTLNAAQTTRLPDQPSLTHTQIHLHLQVPIRAQALQRQQANCFGLAVEVVIAYVVAAVAIGVQDNFHFIIGGSQAVQVALVAGQVGEDERFDQIGFSTEEAHDVLLVRVRIDEVEHT